MIKETSLFKNRNFMALWGAQIAALVASYILNFILLVIVYRQTAGTSFQSLSVALVMIAFTLPAFLFSPTAGVVADTFDRKKILITVTALRILCLGALIVAWKSFAALLIITTIFAAATQFFIPAEAAAIPVLVKTRLLTRANALFLTSIYVTFLIGFIGGGIVLSQVGEEGTFLVLIGFFAIALALLNTLPQMVPKQVATKRNHILNPIIQFMEGLRIVRESKERTFALVTVATAQSVIYVLITSVPDIVRRLLGKFTGTNGVYILAPIALGMALGIALTVKLDNKKQPLKFITSLLVLQAIALTCTALYLQFKHGTATFIGLLPLLLALAVFGASNASMATVSQTLLQISSPDAVRGRVFAALQMLVSIGAVVPLLLTGVINQAVGPGYVVLSVGLALAVLAGYLSYWNNAQRRAVAERSNGEL